jgi:hypothetical protein
MSIRRKQRDFLAGLTDADLVCYSGYTDKNSRSS